MRAHCRRLRAHARAARRRFALRDDERAPSKQRRQSKASGLAYVPLFFDRYALINRRHKSIDRSAMTSL
jgi:hypothetical protein